MVAYGIPTVGQRTVLTVLDVRRNGMPNNRSRGRKGENEAAAVLGGHRISRTGEPGSDIVDWQGRTWEVKRIKRWSALILAWFAQRDDQGDYGIITRADRDKWYVIIEVSRYLNEVKE